MSTLNKQLKIRWIWPVIEAGAELTAYRNVWKLFTDNLYIKLKDKNGFQMNIRFDDAIFSNSQLVRINLCQHFWTSTRQLLFVALTVPNILKHRIRKVLGVGKIVALGPYNMYNKDTLTNS